MWINNLKKTYYLLGDSMLKNLLFSLLYFILFIIIANIFITLFNYFNILNIGIIKILKFLIPISAIAINSYILGKKSVKKGFLEGLKLGSVIVIIFLLITLATNTFNYKSLIYYLVMILVSILSSMLGINRREEKNA